jgi:NTP pyrophosphatase (non-canonical NTP hydrolase)
MLKLNEEVGELTQAYLRMTGQSRSPGAPAAFAAEIADVLAHLLLLARRFDVDIDAELDRKWFAWRDVVIPADRAGIQ